MFTFLLAAVLTAPGAANQEFEQVKGAIGQLRVLERSTGTKSTIGSAFVVDASGTTVTNYHVVAEAVYHPDRFRLELVLADGRQAAAEIVDVDVVNDLAVARTALVSVPLEISDEIPPIGAAIHAFGNPYDLGNTVVTGTSSGLVEGSLYERLHFTGALNSGMSGGPALFDGKVIGVNVASAGDSVGFLVPARYVSALVRRPGAETSSTTSLLDRVRIGLVDNQERIARRLLAASLPSQSLGSFRAPERWDSTLRCWANVRQPERQAYTWKTFSCAPAAPIFLNGGHSTGVVQYNHEYAEAPTLSTLRFHALFSSTFAPGDEDVASISGSEEDVTRFRCRTSFVQHGTTLLRAAYCLRAFKKLPGLYDAVLAVAVLGSPRTGLASRLVLGGFSHDQATVLARRYLESFAWIP